MSQPAEDRLLKWRKDFPILRDSVYLLSHSMGAMPRAAYGEVMRYIDEWGAQGISAYDAWMPRLAETADRVGDLLNAPKGTIVFHQNTSTLMAAIISAIAKPGQRRSKVVYTDLNFPSIHYSWIRHEELGLRVKIVKSPDGISIPTERMVEAIDGETLAVVLDHGIFRSGFLQEVGEIAKAARAKGAYTIVDAYQTVGCVPIDVIWWDIDFLVAGSHKWLCGGPGASFLYVKKDLLGTLEPRVTGWFSHARPFDFDMKLEYAPTAMRFATGTPGLPAVHAARAGIEIVSKVGVKAVRAKSQRLTQRLIEKALAAGIKVHSPLDPNRRSGVVCLDFPGADRAEAELLKRRIFVDYRPACGLRVSAHFYTKEDELLGIIDEIKSLKKR